jgi:hypothetical protein
MMRPRLTGFAEVPIGVRIARIVAIVGITTLTYARLIALLVAVRKKAEIRQQLLSRRLRKPQSFVAKYEGGERRIDLVEFIAIVQALEADPVGLFREFLAGEPQAKSSRKKPVK